MASAGANLFGTGSASIRATQDLMLLSGLPLYALSCAWQRGRKEPEREPLTVPGSSETGIQKPVGTMP